VKRGLIFLLPKVTRISFFALSLSLSLSYLMSFHLSTSHTNLPVFTAKPRFCDSLPRATTQKLPKNQHIQASTQHPPTL
jgi:hypothetical protein